MHNGIGAFITLTYNEDACPKDGSLVPRDFRLFMKRLRFDLEQKVKYYHCGEYGDQDGRPHYHACVLGHGFPDRWHWTTRNGIPSYRSPQLEKLWKLGFSELSDITAKSAAYVARYIMKKVNGDKAETHYMRVDKETGECWWIHPEYATMSKGFGRSWFEKYGSDIFPRDETVFEGRLVQTPKFYDKLLAEIDEELLAHIKSKRVANAKLRAKDSTPRRLRDRETVKQAQIGRLKRQ
mgnify:CR=1 FL=1